MESNTRKTRLVIGIDPDVDKSGVGIIDLERKEVSKAELNLPALVEYLTGIEDVMVIIEAGWKNGSNFHLKNKGQWHASKIGEQVGRNHEVSKIIGEFCEYHGIPYRFVKPLARCYHGKDGKISHEELMELIEERGYTMVKCRTNQEVRDAIRLAIVYKAFVC